MGTIRKLFMKNWNIFSLIYYFETTFSWLLYIFSLKNLPGKENHSEIYAHSLYIFLIKIRYSWIFSKIFVNSKIIRQITILANWNNIHEMKLWQIGIGIYSWPKYQRIDSWENLFAEHSTQTSNLHIQKRSALQYCAARCNVVYNTTILWNQE